MTKRWPKNKSPIVIDDWQMAYTCLIDARPMFIDRRSMPHGYSSMYGSILYRWLIDVRSMLCRWLIDVRSMLHQWFIDVRSMLHQWFIDAAPVAYRCPVDFSKIIKIFFTSIVNYNRKVQQKSMRVKEVARTKSRYADERPLRVRMLPRLRFILFFSLHVAGQRAAEHSYHYCQIWFKCVGCYELFSTVLLWIYLPR